jgi:hypothetical protein
MKSLKIFAMAAIMVVCMTSWAGAVSLAGEYVFSGNISNALGIDGMSGGNEIQITVNLNNLGQLSSWGYKAGSVNVFYDSSALSAYTNSVTTGTNLFTLSSNSGLISYYLNFGTGGNYLREFSFANGQYSGFFANLNTMEFHQPANTPIPPAAWLLGSGLLGLIGIGGRRNYLNRA